MKRRVQCWTFAVMSWLSGAEPKKMSFRHHWRSVVTTILALNTMSYRVLFVPAEQPPPALPVTVEVPCRVG